MDFFYCPYSITPLKRQDRTSTLEPKFGIYIKAQSASGISYADYFPHASMGDKGCEQFLDEFKLQKNEYERKIHHLLLKDKEYQAIPQKKFFNHQLWSGTEDFEASIIKYKLSKFDDQTFLDPLKRGIKVRLDANAQFTRTTFAVFLKSIPNELHGLIEYVEDPIFENDWSNLGVKIGRDAIHGHPYNVRIHRPNREFFPAEEKKVIFSSYLGSNLGRWHTYCELVECGNLEEVHGIISPGFIKEEKSFLTGSYVDGFIPNKDAVKDIYTELAKQEWKSFCSF